MEFVLPAAGRGGKCELLEGCVVHETFFSCQVNAARFGKYYVYCSPDWSFPWKVMKPVSKLIFFFFCPFCKAFLGMKDRCLPCFPFSTWQNPLKHHPPYLSLNSPKHLISKGEIQLTIIFPQLRQSCTIYNRSLENSFLPSAAASIDLSQLPTVNLGIVQEQILQSMKRWSEI